MDGYISRRNLLKGTFAASTVNVIPGGLAMADGESGIPTVKGKALGRKALMELTTIVTPDTILRWHRQLVAKKWDYSKKRKSAGRPRIRQVVVDLILRFAKSLR